MLPMFQRVLVEKNRWLEEAEMTELFSVGQCLPGVIATNTAVFIGYKQRGILGSIAAVLGVAAPSIILILIIANVLSNFSGIPIVQRAFTGLRVCVSVLIFHSVIKLWKASIADKLAIIIFSLVFIVAVFTNIPIAILVVLAGLSGIAITTIRKRKSEGET